MPDRPDGNTPRPAPSSETAQPDQAAMRAELGPTAARFLDGGTTVEIGRQFTEPQGPDDLLPLPWYSEHHGPPDLTKPPPKTNGYPMRWVRRTITKSAWEALDARQFLAAIPTVAELVPSARLAEIEASLVEDSDDDY